MSDGSCSPSRPCHPAEVILDMPGSPAGYDPKQRILISDLPAQMQQMLEVFDDDHDGYLSLEQLQTFARAYAKQRQQIRWLRSTIVMNAVIMVLFLLGVFALSWVVASLTRVTDVRDGVLVAKGTDEAVAVSQALFRDEGITAASPDREFAQLRYVQLTSPAGAVASLEVQGFVRLSEEAVVVFTPVGGLKVGLDHMALVPGDVLDFLKEAGLVAGSQPQGGHWQLQQKTTLVGFLSRNQTCGEGLPC